MKSVHLISGIITLVIFALTGQYMAQVIGLPETEFNAQKMMYRASHIYLLWAGLINTCLGVYWRPLALRNPFIQLASSWLLVTCQPVLLLAFFTEPGVEDQDRLLTLAGCIMALTGTGLAVLAAFLARGQSSASE